LSRAPPYHAHIDSSPLPEKISRDSLLYLINLPGYLQYSNKENNDLPFISLYSQHLKKRMRRYKLHLQWLLDHDILEFKSGYLAGVRFQGYRVKEEWGAPKDYIAIKVYIRSHANRKNKTIKKEMILTPPQHLVNWFDGLKIDAESCWAIAHENDMSFTQQMNLRYLIHAIENKHFFYLRDNTGYRLHTTLSNMNKLFRPLITNCNNELISIDIKNSQPYFSLLLFNEQKGGDSRAPYASTILAGKGTYGRSYQMSYQILRGDNAV
jgi:hypothetical protein